MWREAKVLKGRSMIEQKSMLAFPETVENDAQHVGCLKQRSSFSDQAIHGDLQEWKSLEIPQHLQTLRSRVSATKHSHAAVGNCAKASMSCIIPDQKWPGDGRINS